MLCSLWQSVLLAFPPFNMQTNKSDQLASSSHVTEHCTSDHLSSTDAEADAHSHRRMESSAEPVKEQEAVSSMVGPSSGEPNPNPQRYKALKEPYKALQGAYKAGPYKALNVYI